MSYAAKEQKVLNVVFPESAIWPFLIMLTTSIPAKGPQVVRVQTFWRI